jgi:hypothetical protein
MSQDNLFQSATRNKTRFESQVGLLTVEQLWDLPLTSQRGASLDDVGRRLLQALKAQSEESLVTAHSTGRQATERSIELVKAIIDTKQREAEEARSRAANAAQKAKLLEILARKQDTALEAMSEDEIKAALSTL